MCSTLGQHKDLNFEKTVEILSRQILSCCPLNQINWKDILNGISWEQQEYLLNQTILSELNISQPIKRSYQLQFLKVLLENLENQSDIEIHDSLYELICSLKVTVNEEEEKYFNRHYILHPKQDQISLKECRNFVSDGTTGLCSWPASILLSEWLLNHKDILKGGNVIELGAGTGLAGFIASKYCGASRALLSDGSEKVVKLLEENLVRNFKTLKKNPEDIFYSIIPNDDRDDEVTKIGIMQLEWENINKIKLEDIFAPNYILAADVTYDVSVLPTLMKAIDYIFTNVHNQCSLILASTIRNEATFNNFISLLDEHNFKIIDESSCFPEKYFHWDESVPIKLHKITR